MEPAEDNFLRNYPKTQFLGELIYLQDKINIVETEILSSMRAGEKISDALDFLIEKGYYWKKRWGTYYFLINGFKIKVRRVRK